MNWVIGAGQFSVYIRCMSAQEGETEAVESDFDRQDALSEESSQCISLLFAVFNS